MRDFNFSDCFKYRNVVLDKDCLFSGVEVDRLSKMRCFDAVSQLLSVKKFFSDDPACLDKRCGKLQHNVSLSQGSAFVSVTDLDTCTDLFKVEIYLEASGFSMKFYAGGNVSINPTRFASFSSKQIEEAASLYDILCSQC